MFIQGEERPSSLFSPRGVFFFNALYLSVIPSRHFFFLSKNCIWSIHSKFLFLWKLLKVWIKWGNVIFTFFPFFFLHFCFYWIPINPSLKFGKDDSKILYQTVVQGCSLFYCFLILIIKSMRWHILAILFIFAQSPFSLSIPNYTCSDVDGAARRGVTLKICWCSAIFNPCAETP